MYEPSKSMPLFSNILRVTFYVNACISENITQITAESPLLPSSGALSFRYNFNTQKNNRINFLESSFHNSNNQDSSNLQRFDFLSCLHTRIGHVIKILKSMDAYSEVVKALCRDETDATILKWMEHALTSKPINIALFGELKKVIQQSVIPMYDNLKDVIFNYENRELLPLFESYALLNQEWELLEKHFKENSNIKASDAQKIILPAIRNSYEKFVDILNHFKNNSNQFEPNSDDVDIFFRKIKFFLECEKKANLISIKESFTRLGKKIVTPERQIYQVFSNINDDSLNLALKREIHLQLKNILEMNKSGLLSSSYDVPFHKDRLYFFNFKYDVPDTFIKNTNATETNNMQDFFYSSINSGLFFIHRVNTDPMNIFSNEIIFRNFNSDFTSRTVMIFYEIDNQTKNKYYWIVSEAFNSPISSELTFLEISKFFSELSNFKEYFTHYLSALKYLHSKKISGLYPRIGKTYIYFGPSVNDLPFDLKYAKIGKNGFSDRIKLDYQILFHNINLLSKYIDVEESNILECFIEEISQQARENADELGVNIQTIENSSLSWMFCFYYSIIEGFRALFN